MWKFKKCKINLRSIQSENIFLHSKENNFPQKTNFPPYFTNQRKMRKSFFKTMIFTSTKHTLKVVSFLLNYYKILGYTNYTFILYSKFWWNSCNLCIMNGLTHWWFMYNYRDNICQDYIGLECQVQIESQILYQKIWLMHFLPLIMGGKKCNSTTRLTRNSCLVT